MCLTKATCDDDRIDVGIKRPHPLELDNSEDDEGIMLPSSQKRLKEEEEGQGLLSLSTLRYILFIYATLCVVCNYGVLN